MSEPQQCAIEFEMDGKRYGMTMYAESWTDAERRMRALRLTGKVVGFPCWSAQMPSSLGYAALPFVAMLTGILNFFRGRNA